MKNEDRVRVGVLGPHELREAQLMLAGKKEVAFFSFDYPDEHFQDMKHCLEQGIFQSIKFGAQYNARQLASDPEVQARAYALLGAGPYEHLVVYVPPAEHKAKRFIQLFEIGRKQGYSDAIEREIGRVLGYSEADIEYYIEHTKRDRAIGAEPAAGASR